LLLWKKRRLPQARSDYLWLGLLGLVFALHWYSYFRSIKLADASLAAIGVATFGIHLLLLNAIFYGERFKHSDYAALILALVGIYLTSPTLNFDSDKLQGFLLAIVSGLLYACLPLINRRVAHLGTNTRALGQFFFALLAFLTLLPQSNFQLSQTDWSGLIFLGVFSTLIAHTLWIKASTELPSNLTAVLYYCYVPLAILLGYFFLGEALNWQKLVGAGLIIIANLQVAYFHQKNPK